MDDHVEVCEFCFAIVGDHSTLGFTRSRTFPFLSSLRRFSHTHMTYICAHMQEASTGMELAVRRADALIARQGFSHTKVILILSGIAFFLFLLIWLS